MNDISGQPRALCSRHERYWPRRLLHIQSMRSFEKQESNTFGTSPPVHEPCYGTISYTWGRFELSRGSAISIYGIPWKPPSIDPRHFTVEQFENAIRSIASISGVEFLWLDVACAKFSHRPASATMDEDVSMQREIFSGASYNCIWLTEIEWEILADIFVTLSRIANNANCEGGQPIEFENFDLLLQKTVTPAFKRLLVDPWFSSLWTLQEAMAKPNAILLSAEGSPISLSPYTHDLISDGSEMEIILKNGNSVLQRLSFKELTPCKPKDGKDSSRTGYMTLRHLVHLSRSILDLILFRVQHLSRDSDERLSLEDMGNTITRSGLPSFASFNLLRLWKIAQNRHEMHPGDRIEYIHKHVFRFPTGPGTPFADSASSPVQLEAYFSKQLILHFPVLSQLFSRHYPCGEGFSWGLDQGCEFLDLDIIFTSFQEYIPQVTTRPVITGDGSHHIGFNGPAYDFGGTLKILLSQSLSFSRLLGIFFDSTTINLPSTTVSIPSMASLPTRQPSFQSSSLSPKTQNWRVALDEQVQHVNAFNHLLLKADADVRMLVLARAPGFGDGPNLAIGLIVMKNRGNTDAWRRMGLCFWMFQVRRETEMGAGFGLEGLGEVDIEGILA
ncbi:uncharacterized protein K441DRAFT_668164 [Cenococcum geophilum 1.58]|uniref:uncharacterized protein n=1 Tax=Cenococcum geophilum 1.58 TaxID=794803 RepID=UPI00358F5E4F|nr:hypothetical protein K441DRAFT_668164 [Cenococcum geophilum 1.58]